MTRGSNPGVAESALPEAAQAVPPPVPGLLTAVAEALGSPAKKGAPLAPFTAMRVGGPADLLFVAESMDELVHAVRVARQHDLPFRVLGGGCNVLIADQGVRGLVIINRAPSIACEDRTVRAESGAKLALLARKTVDRCLAGMAWAAGLPGTVGGAVVGNAGAFGGDIAGVLRSGTVLGPDGQVVEREKAWFDFAYRSSRLKEGAGKVVGAVTGVDSVPHGKAPPTMKGSKAATFDMKGSKAARSVDTVTRHVVLEATFQLEAGDGATLRARADEVLRWRKARYPSRPTMGSTFKNPADHYAGQLIEEVGLKGYRVGGARISDQHANFFINDGDATAGDVLALIEHTQAEVERTFGVELELEIELVGW